LEGGKSPSTPGTGRENGQFPVRKKKEEGVSGGEVVVGAAVTKESAGERKHESGAQRGSAGGTIHCFVHGKEKKGRARCNGNTGTSPHGPKRTARLLNIRGKKSASYGPETGHT